MNIRIDSVVLSYNIPIVVTGSSGSENYIGVAYDEDQSGIKYYFFRPKKKLTNEFLNGSLDLLYIINDSKIENIYLFVGDLVVGKQIVGKEFKQDLTPDMLPDPGLFAPYQENERKGGHKVVARTIIDGRWNISDLKYFSDILQDCYAFSYGLNINDSQLQKRIITIFSKYPWKGGYSPVNFFDELYGAIPANDQVDISEIKYASPGYIDLIMNQKIAESINALITNFSGKNNFDKLYTEVHTWLAQNKLLGKDVKKADITEASCKQIRTYITSMKEALSINISEEQLSDLSGKNNLLTLKIILAYHRRLKKLSNYVSTGKARNAFEIFERL